MKESMEKKWATPTQIEEGEKKPEMSRRKRKKYLKKVKKEAKEIAKTKEKEIHEPEEGLPREVRELLEKHLKRLQRDVENFQKIYDLNGIDEKIERPALTKEQVEKITELQKKDFYLELHYLPKFKMTEDTKLPRGFAPYPEEMFEWQKKKDIDSESLELEGQYVLIDSRPKPEFQDSERRYGLYKDETILGGVIEELRQKKEIKYYEYDTKEPIAGRSKTTWLEVKEKILPRYAKELGLKPEEVRLPKQLEFYLIGNLYHKEWGRTDVHEWQDDRCGPPRRALQASSDSGMGGLSCVERSEREWPGEGFRPLVKL